MGRPEEEIEEAAQGKRHVSGESEGREKAQQAEGEAGTGQ